MNVEHYYCRFVTGGIARHNNVFRIHRIMCTYLLYLYGHYICVCSKLDVNCVVNCVCARRQDGCVYIVRVDYIKEQ